MCSMPLPDETSTSPSADLDFDQIQEQLQLKNEREQMALKVLTERKAEDKLQPEPVPVVSLVSKPIRLLKREQPRRPKLSESEMSDEARRLEEMTLDERRANYDKVRERIFNASTSEEKPTKHVPKVEEKPQPQPTEIVTKTEKVEVSTPNEVMVETINHLTYVQMLSDQTPSNMMRPPVQSIPIQQPPVRIQPGRPPQRIIQPPIPPSRYGAPPQLHGLPSGPIDLSQMPPPHMFPPPMWQQQQYGNMSFSSNGPPAMMQAPPLNTIHSTPQPLRDCFPPLNTPVYYPPSTGAPNSNVHYNANTPSKRRGQQNNRNLNQPRK
ncbi:hypothetical protein M3Y94_01068100 [Aphelenchoides besseyi]|nr:hypothetical protein M3Y94_01068100 [Aphelenchoides besseyi]KAI6216441.1 hypothetical protein M3Y95_01275300 [Aphelenchoides besseyi]